MDDNEIGKSKNIPADLLIEWDMVRKIILHRAGKDKKETAVQKSAEK